MHLLKARTDFGVEPKLIPKIKERDTKKLDEKKETKVFEKTKDNAKVEVVENTINNDTETDFNLSF